LLHRSGSIVRQGLSALGIGLVIFIVGFAFFEGVLNISDDRGLAPLGRQALPIALIVAGALVIVSRLWPRPEPQPRVSMPPPADQIAPPVQAAPQPPPWASSSSSLSTLPRAPDDEETTA
jgi:hypothetical protein